MLRRTPDRRSGRACTEPDRASARRGVPTRAGRSHPEQRRQCPAEAVGAATAAVRKAAENHQSSHRASSLPPDLRLAVETWSQGDFELCDPPSPAQGQVCHPSGSAARRLPPISPGRCRRRPGPIRRPTSSSSGRARASEHSRSRVVTGSSRGLSRQAFSRSPLRSPVHVFVTRDIDRSRDPARPRVRARLARRVRGRPRARAVPTQLVFVPMLFLLPLELVPLFVAAGVMLGNVLELVAGRMRRRARARAARRAPGYSVGPVLVLVAAGGPAPGDAGGARARRGARSPVRLRLRERDGSARIALGMSPRLLRPRRWPGVSSSTRPSRRSGFSPRSAAVDQPAAFLLVLPLVGLLAHLRPRTAQPHRPRARAQPRVPRHRAPARRRRRGRRRLHGLAQPRRRRAGSSRVADELGLDARRPARRGVRARCCTTSARSASRTRSSTSPGR